jgi:hypothetical protein
MYHYFLTLKIAIGNPTATFGYYFNYFSALSCSHCWLAIPQDVLQADWQDV